MPSFTLWVLLMLERPLESDETQCSTAVLRPLSWRDGERLPSLAEWCFGNAALERGRSLWELTTTADRGGGAAADPDSAAAAAAAAAAATARTAASPSPSPLTPRRVASSRRPSAGACVLACEKSDAVLLVSRLTALAVPQP